MISGEDARNKGFTKRYVEISRKKKKTQTKDMGWKKLIDYDRWEKKGEDVKTKDLQRDIWRHLERKRITKTKD